MNRFVLFFSFQFLFALKVGILPFEVKNDLGIDQAPQAIASLLSNHLRYNDEIQVEERIHLNQMIAEKAAAQSGYFSQSQQSEIAQLENVDALVIGQAMKLGDFYVISARMVDVASGDVLASGTVEFEGKQQMNAELNRLAWYLSGKDLSSYRRELTRRYYEYPAVRIQMGVGMATSLFEEWHQNDQNQSFHKSNRDQNPSGLHWQVSYENSFLETFIGGIYGSISQSQWLGCLLYPSHSIGIGVRGMYNELNQGTSEELRSGASFVSVLGVLSFRLNESVRFSLEKGITLGKSSSLYYQETSRKTPSIEVEERFSFLHSPTLATVDYFYTPETSFHFFYYHNLERSLQIQDQLYSNSNQALERDVTGYFRIIGLSVGYRFGL